MCRRWRLWISLWKARIKGDIPSPFLGLKGGHLVPKGGHFVLPPIIRILPPQGISPWRVSPAGLLAIRAYDAKDAAEVEARWLEPLVSWAGSVGLSGVVIDAAFAPKDAMTAAEASA